MGKIPTSFRPITSTQLIKKPTQLPPPQPQSLRNRTLIKPSDNNTPPPRNPFKSPNLTDAKSLINTITSTSKTQLDLKFHNPVLQSYASIASLTDTVHLYQHLTKSQPNFKPDHSTFHILLSHACRSSPSLDNVYKVLNLMVNTGVKPDHVTTDIAVRSLCESGLVDEAMSLVKELSEKHCKPDSYTYNFLLKHLCKRTDSLSVVYGFMDTMKKSFGVRADLVSYTILIDNVCNARNLREAKRLVNALSEAGFKADCFVYNTLMKGYCSLSKGTEAVGIYKEMVEVGVEPDMVTYNTLIFGLSKCGRVEEARKYLKVMVGAGYEPDAVTYTSLMNGMCRKGETLGALSLLEEMEGRGCVPNACTYNTLLHGLCKARLMDKGIELYELMKLNGVKLETTGYATLLRALVKSGKVAEAYEVFDYAVESKSLSDASAYSALETTLKWLKKAKEQGLVV